MTKPLVSSCEGAQTHQVVDAILLVLDVAVEHGAVGVQPQFVRSTSRLDPLVAGQLVIADDAPYAIAKNLRAAAGE